MLKPFAGACNAYLMHKYGFQPDAAQLVLGCRGLCARLETIGGGKNSAYSLGYKRCSSCDIYIKWNSCRCPCCKLPLRVKKRTKQNHDHNNNNSSNISDSESIISQAHA